MTNDHRRPTTAKMKQIIKKVLQEKLDGQQYQSEHASQWTKDISDEVKVQLKGKWCVYA